MRVWTHSCSHDECLVCHAAERMQDWIALVWAQFSAETFHQEQSLRPSHTATAKALVLFISCNEKVVWTGIPDEFSMPSSFLSCRTVLTIPL